MSVEGVHVEPHVQSSEMRYRQKPDFSLGARVEVFLRNASLEAPEKEDRMETRRQALIAAEKALGFDPGRNPADLAVLQELVRRKQ